MAYTIRLQDELGHELKRRREAARLTKSALAQRAGKVREVVYRLEAGEDVTVASLLAVLVALGLARCRTWPRPGGMAWRTRRLHSA
jgi:DNA-binding XRE family transcriptional regulator